MLLLLLHFLKCCLLLLLLLEEELAAHLDCLIQRVLVLLLHQLNQGGVLLWLLLLQHLHGLSEVYQLVVKG